MCANKYKFLPSLFNKLLWKIHKIYTFVYKNEVYNVIQNANQTIQIST